MENYIKNSDNSSAIRPTLTMEKNKCIVDILNVHAVIKFINRYDWRKSIELADQLNLKKNAMAITIVLRTFNHCGS